MFQNSIKFTMNNVQGPRKKTLLEDLREHVECPVCFEVPRVGPMYACPYGHHVCQRCKRESCPICRAAMGNNKSILAVEIIENILHKCKFVKCEDKFPLGDELSGHERKCKHRIVSCPTSDCDEKFALSDLSQHFGRRRRTCCSNAEPRVVEDTTDTVEKNFNIVNWLGWDWDWTYWYTYRDAQLALCMNKAGDHYHYYIVMFESDEVCSGYTVDMNVFKRDSPPEVARNYLKFRCNPISIDTPKSEIQHLGLTVHHKVMEKMVLEGDTFEFTVSFSFV